MTTTTLTRAAIALTQQWEAERAKRTQALADARVIAAARIGARIDDVPEDSTFRPIAAAILAEGISINDRGEYRPSDEIQTLLQAHAAMWQWLNIEGLSTMAYQTNGQKWITYSPPRGADELSVTDASNNLARWMYVKPKV